jgi:hypothetical protein
MEQVVETDRFLAKSDDSEEVEIIEYTEMKTVSAMSIPDREIPELKGYQTSEGESVHKNNNGTYEIIDRAFFDPTNIFRRDKT